MRFPAPNTTLGFCVGAAVVLAGSIAGASASASAPAAPDTLATPVTAARFAQAAPVAAAKSARTKVKVKVTLPTKSVQQGSGLRVAAKVTRAKKAAKRAAATLQVKLAGQKKWRSIGTKRTSKRGKVTFTLRPATSGQVRIRAKFKGKKVISRSVSFTVTKKPTTTKPNPLKGADIAPKPTSSGSTPAGPKTYYGTVGVGTILRANDALVSNNGKHRVVMQSDGNFVFYRDGSVAWATGTNGSVGAYFAIQGDGNVVLYNSGGSPLWDAKSSGSGLSVMSITDSGLVTIDAPGKMIGRLVKVNTGAGHVNLRASASTSAHIHGTQANHTPIAISCSGSGSAVTGPYGKTTLWNRMPNGWWVSDAMLYTGSNAAVVPACGGASSGTGGGGGAARKTGQKASYNQGYSGYCTWGAYEKWKQATGYYPLIGGNAIAWDENAAARGWTVTSTPEARSIVVINEGYYGHVGWVRAVEQRSDGLYIHTTEMNGGNVWVDSYNGVTNEFGKFVDKVRKHNGSTYRYILAP